MNPVAALAFTLVLAAIPTLLFLALWRGLMYLRDDDLLEQARQMREGRPQYGVATGVGGAGASAATTTEDDRTAVCPGCGAANAAGMDYCRNCLSRLPQS
jgi:hypothetical protein